MTAKTTDINEVHWGASSADTVTATRFEEIFGKTIGAQGFRVGLQPRLIANGDAKRLVYSLTQYSDKNPNTSKSLVNFYKKTLTGSALPPLSPRGVHDLWQIRATPVVFGDFFTTPCPINVRDYKRLTDRQINNKHPDRQIKQKHNNEFSSRPCMCWWCRKVTYSKQ